MFDGLKDHRAVLDENDGGAILGDPVGPGDELALAVAGFGGDDLLVLDHRGLGGVVPEAHAVDFVVGEEQADVVRVVFGFAGQGGDGEAPRQDDLAGGQDGVEDGLGERVVEAVGGDELAGEFDIDLVGGGDELDFGRLGYATGGQDRESGDDT